MQNMRKTRKADLQLAPKGKDYVLGVDGCPDGWVAIALPVHPQGKWIKASIVENFTALLTADQKQASFIMIDMPIGLMDKGRRPCEQMARQKLQARASSVFPAPRRPMLVMKTYEAANQWGKNQGTENGGGLSKQAWNILHKIAEIDHAITPAQQSRIGEAHPELAFTRLNKNTPCTYNKKTAEGIVERTALLQHHGITDPQAPFHALKEEKGVKVGLDDVLDATAIALTARARLKGKAIHLFDGTFDARGLKVEIWG